MSDVSKFHPDAAEYFNRLPAYLQTAVQNSRRKIQSKEELRHYIEDYLEERQNRCCSD